MAQIDRKMYKNLRAQRDAELQDTSQPLWMLPDHRQNHEATSSKVDHLLTVLRLRDVPLPVIVALCLLCVIAAGLGLLLHSEISNSDLIAYGTSPIVVDHAPQSSSSNIDNAQSSVQTTTQNDVSLSSDTYSEAEKTIVVDVDGAVATPGVYRLPSGARIADAIEAAGGLLPQADTALINQAQTLSDGLKVYVYAQQSDSATNPDANTNPTTAVLSTSTMSAGLININTADATQLQELPGVGPSTAEAIVQDRQRNGAFTSKEDLMRVSGIGEKKYAKLESKICI